MPLPQVTDGTFQEAVLNSATPVLVDFTATWCAPCRVLGPILEQIAAETTKVGIVQADIDSNRTIAVKYGIMALPTMLFFKGGQPVRKSVGLRTSADIRKMIDEVAA
jgi:thioredoxin 1